jgi:diguanylate cyclase (GGDEF)-like protein
MMPTTDKQTETTPTIGVLDIVQGGGLAAAVVSAGMSPRELSSFDDLVSAVGTFKCRVVLIAFEALWPDPQKALRRVRAAAPDAQIVVTYAEGTPRLRLGQRLWSIGAFDHFVSRIASTPSLAQTLRHALSEATAEPTIPITGAHPPESALQLLQKIGAGFASHHKVAGLVRELHRRLPAILPYDVLGVLAHQPTRSKFFLFSSRPTNHELIWKLAESACATVNRSLSTRKLGPEDVEMIHDPSAREQSTRTPLTAVDPERLVALPMSFCGESVGAVTMLSASPGALTEEAQRLLQLVITQLSIAIHNAQLLERADEMSGIDRITGLHNKHHLAEVLAREWARAQRYSLQLTLAMIDIDRFSQINRLHGHVVGDAVLRSTAETLRKFIRGTDHIVRYGGDEFLIILPETGAPAAATPVERMRIALRAEPVRVPNGSVDVSVSAGIASSPGSSGRTAEELIVLAERALNAAKDAGGDRTCISGVIRGQVTSGGSREVPVEQRTHVRVDCELPTIFIPLGDLERPRPLNLSSLNVSAGGLALRDVAQQLRPGMVGLVYFEDRSDPLLCRVNWTQNREGIQQAGLQFLKASELIGGQRAPLEPRKALLILDTPEARAAATRVLKSMRADVSIFDTASEALDPSALEGIDVTLISESLLESEVGKTLLLSRARQAAERLIVINESLDRDRAIEMISSKRFEHLIPSRQSSEEALFATLQKLLRNDHFGIKRYLLPGADTKLWTLTEVHEKNYVLTGVRTIATEVSCHPRLIDLLIAGVDEMLINAFYRAPAASLDSIGKKPVTVECGSDGRLLAVGVSDEHGQLKTEDIYESLAVTPKERSKINLDDSSAHLGFRMMLSNLSHLAINVDPGRRTEIVGLMDLRKSLREHRSSAPGLGVFKRT